MHRVLIIEDNRKEAEALRRCIERYGQLNAEQFDVTVMRSAVDYVAEGGAWSIVFMDIDLPGINGMEAAELLRTYDPVTPIIFVTNLAQYAVRGYEVDALGFIVKPVSYNSFRIPMDKAMRAVRQRVPSLLIKTQDGIRLVPQTDVVWVEISGHYLSWHIAGEKDPLNERGSLAQAAEKLAGGSMVSISKSVMANATHIQAIVRDTLVMTDGARLAISRSKKREVMAQIAARGLCGKEPRGADHPGGARAARPLQGRSPWTRDITPGVLCRRALRLRGSGRLSMQDIALDLHLLLRRRLHGAEPGKLPREAPLPPADAGDDRAGD